MTVFQIPVIPVFSLLPSVATSQHPAFIRPVERQCGLVSIQMAVERRKDSMPTSRPLHLLVRVILSHITLRR